MIDKFRISLCSDLDYEEMVADIHYENNFFAIVSQEAGIENMQIEIFPKHENTSWHFNLDELIRTLQLAKINLINFQKVDDDKENS